MKISIISGSHVSKSQSGRVAEYLATRLKSIFGIDIDVYQRHLGENPLPFWNDEFPSEAAGFSGWAETSKHLSESDGFIFVTPE